MPHAVAWAFGASGSGDLFLILCGRLVLALPVVQEPWILAILSMHISLFIITLAARNNTSIQGCIFVFGSKCFQLACGGCDAHMHDVCALLGKTAGGSSIQIRS